MDLLSYPIMLVVGGIVLLALMVLWNRYNTNRQKHRRHRSFKNNYYEKKKGRRDSEE